MAVEPITQATGVGVGLAIPLTVAAGSMFGIDYATIAFAFLGGALVLLYIERMSWFGCFTSLATATFVGSLTGQHIGTLVAALVVYATFYFIPAVDPLSVVLTVLTPIKAMLAFISGLVSQAGIRAAIKRIQRWGEGDVGGKA